MKSIPSRSGKKYFITFINDCTRYCYVYLLNSKDEAIDAFKQYKIEVENQLNKKIKMIRSDRGREYEFPFQEICLENGIIHQMTAPYTPQQNGVAKRKNRTLKEIYMEQPEGFIVPGQENKVCRLIKSLYGLKQAPKQWHAQFDKVMLSNGFKINECDKCVYIKNTPNHEVIVCLYVDDMLIISKNIIDINATKRMLSKSFDMKDLGVADFILDIKIYRTPQGLALSQSHYIDKVLDKFKYLNFKEVKTPIDLNLALANNKGESESQVDYAKVLGCLMYIMNCTRPNIACAISKLSRYTSNPNKTHWMPMRRVLGYLKHTQNFALHYKNYPAVIEGYSDANWITGSTESKSTSGYVFTVGGGAVSWKSSKQTCIARSTMEAEFIALNKAGEEAEWIWNFLEDIPFWPKLLTSIGIHCDSQAAIGRAESVMYNGKSRHIRRKHNTVRQLISSGVTQLIT